VSPHYADATVTLHHGDCLDVLRELPDNSIDAVVTDPPYGLEFMGKEWDKFDRKGPASFENLGQREWVHADGRPKASPMKDKPRWSTMGPSAMLAFGAWCEEWTAECLRVLKPGGHLLAFGGTRTWHRLACAVEDAGFEVRDSIAWLYGSGFPKSLDVSKAIDKAAGAERTEGQREWSGGQRRAGVMGDNLGTQTLTKYDAPATPDAERWQGWGTALKPAFEPVVVARKPLAGTVAANVLAHGTGALNVDATRTNSTSSGPGTTPRSSVEGQRGSMAGAMDRVEYDGSKGRWPANVVLDESQAAALDTQSGDVLGAVSNGHKGRAGLYEDGLAPLEQHASYADTGGASRFFYTAKAATDERVRVAGIAHPTVKPLSLMRWLVRLVTPPGGTVLEPFAGSGTTVEACILEGFGCIAIEREADYLPLIVQRINRRRDPVAAIRATGEDGGLFDLFDEEPPA
jgi:DNA modification methylase